MKHPYEYSLKEYKFAIDHLAPTVPTEVKEEAMKMYEMLIGNQAATPDSIHEALVKTGKAEYPHRHAYAELTRTAGGAKRNELVLEHVDETVRAKLKALLDTGATLDEIVKSNLFEEQLTADERYQVQDGILDADEHMKEEMEGMVEKKKADYDALVEKYKKQMEMIQTEIEKLRALASKDPKWKAEILDKAAQLEEGWSVTEKDPTLENVQKEIEYWRGTLGEEV